MDFPCSPLPRPYLTSKAESLPPKAISPESPKYVPVLSTTRKADISEMR